MLVWAIYDITSDKTRNKVAKMCQNIGLYRVQKSVFLGNLSRNEMDELAVASLDTIDKTTDSVYIFPMCEEDFHRCKLLGLGFDEDMVTDKLLTMIF